MTIAGRVPPFRYPRINAYSQLPAAFRSVSRLSSPPIAKASTKCPYLSLDSYNTNISLFISFLNKKSFLYPFSFTEKLRLCISLYLFPRFFDNTIFSYHTIQLFPYLQCFIASKKRSLVEVRRIELLTPCLQSRCSPSWAIPPSFVIFSASVLPHFASCTLCTQRLRSRNSSEKSDKISGNTHSAFPKLYIWDYCDGIFLCRVPISAQAKKFLARSLIESFGGSGKTRTSDLTLIRRTL